MESLTSGVQTLLGDPKRAVLRLSLPMMAAMFVQSLYNIVDAIWVAGLGSEALAAVGLFFPFMTGMMALATGLGVGGSSTVSRRIGARDKPSAERAALLTLSLGVLVFPPFPRSPSLKPQNFCPHGGYRSQSRAPARRNPGHGGLFPE